MSGIAAAKKRRAGVTTPFPDTPRLPNGGASVSPSSSQAQGLTLQQVISLLDTRLTKMEKSLNENQLELNVSEKEMLPTNISDILDDFQEKFVILAGEINSLKDTVLKLQTFTMDINQLLFEKYLASSTTSETSDFNIINNSVSVETQTDAPIDTQFNLQGNASEVDNQVDTPNETQTDTSIDAPLDVPVDAHVYTQINPEVNVFIDTPVDE
jgi:hypothetical protein